MEHVFASQPEEPAGLQPFYEAFEDNAWLVVDMIEAMRNESALVGDENAADFFAAIGQAIRAFVRSREPARDR